ncbi:hypothetical protein BH23THE1_BH23THE1_08820 [soil metagenome]
MFSNTRNQYLINYEFCVIIFFHSISWIHSQIAMWTITTLCKKNIALAADLVDNPRKYKYGMGYMLRRCCHTISFDNLQEAVYIRSIDLSLS